MMRLACCLATERGVSVVAPVHDALMVEGPVDAIDDIVARTREAMAEASAVVLDGFGLRSDAVIVRWPGRYMDGRGREFWGRVMALLPAESLADRQAELVAVAVCPGGAESVPPVPDLTIA
jgi:DNA polymerase I